jgi:hypothetical protein
MNENRGSWYLLTGLVIGAALGLFYAWGVQPAEYINTRPASLRADFKDQYRLLIAAAFQANPDPARARARLELLGDADIYAALAQQAQRALAEGRPAGEARTLGELAVALGQPPATLPAAASPSPTLSETAPPPSPTFTVRPTADISATLAAAAPLTPTLTTAAASPGPATRTPRPSTTPTPTWTPLPTRTATATPGQPFALRTRLPVCDPALGRPLLQIFAEDAAGQPVAGVQVILSWVGGSSQFFTGLKPEFGLGYADFELAPGVIYDLRLAEGGQPVTGLQAQECETASGQRYWGGWRLEFQQP